MSLAKNIDIALPRSLAYTVHSRLQVFRVKNEISKKWSFTGKVDGAVGGDSDSAWYLQVIFLWHIGTNKHVDIGYRYYDVDFESGSGLSPFKWDVAHSGPVVGFSWEFGR